VKPDPAMARKPKLFKYFKLVRYEDFPETWYLAPDWRQDSAPDIGRVIVENPATITHAEVALAVGLYDANTVHRQLNSFSAVLSRFEFNLVRLRLVESGDAEDAMRYAEKLVQEQPVAPT